MKSLFLSSIRSFFIALFGMIGISIGFIPLIFILAALVSGGDEDLEVKHHFKPTVVSNAKGVRKVLSDTAPVILKLNIGGVIGSDKLNMYTVEEELIESREKPFKDSRVKAILVHINSPGGTVNDANGIYKALKEYKAQYKVPVYAYVDGLCASGAMYVASACDKILASDVSVIGSVGVIMPTNFNVVGLMEKLGVESKTLSAGKGKDSLNPFRSWKPGEEDNLQSLIDYFYNHFVTIVTENRPKITKTRLINDFGAHVFPAEKAAEYGYIDESGYSLDEALTALAKDIGIDDQYYQVIKMERKISFADLFRGGSTLMYGTVNHKIDLGDELDPKLMNQLLYLYLPEK